MNYKKSIAAFLIVSSVYNATAQTEGVSIKSTVSPPDPSAMLDVESASKGLLVPRVNLLNNIDNTTIKNPATSLLVYCVGNVVMPAGYYYNAGGTGVSPSPNTSWVKLVGSGTGDELWTLAANKTDIYRDKGLVTIGTNSLGTVAINTGFMSLERNDQYTGINAIVYGNSGTHPFYSCLRARGTKDSPGYCQSGDVLAAFCGRSYKGSFIDGCDGSDIYMRATENESPTAHGSNIMFQTTPNGSSSSMTRMVIDHNGNVGIGINSPAAPLHITKNAAASIILDYTGPDPNVFTLSSVGGDGRLYSNAGIDFFVNADNTPGPSTGFVVYSNMSYASGTPLFNVCTDGRVYAGALQLGSDSVLKRNIVPLSGSSLTKIKQLRSVNYVLKADQKGEKQTGFIAQEVEQILPELVTTNQFKNEDPSGKTMSTTSIKSLNYIGIIPHLVKAMQEQQVLIEQLQQRIQALENK